MWLDTTTAALVLGISTGRVRQLARSGRLPFTEHAGRRWFARHHVEQRAAARALARSHSS
ncbi:MAG: helix-turn-helix domain-containing protein [Nocardioides sp.]|uniref:helix-turn-helix domain-containing protein n=1 Tax=Nocardioides sp. TaxID=35761 RepID=UPI0023A6E897|nr:helix-turn-helix domain-containing protein [Nocardioides sp.]MDE0775443.1 helix-turn-helix domain-containing protein [Nocardioides sp.]